MFEKNGSTCKGGRNMHIGVIGLGYVGLVTAVCLATQGHRVIGVDVAQATIDQLQNGKPPIYETGLAELLRQAQSGGAIRFTTDIAHAIKESTVLFVTVETPSLPDGSPDLSQVWEICDQLAIYGQAGQLVIIKSTVPVGTTDAFAERLSNNHHIQFLDVVHNPDFLQQGRAVDDFLSPDRIVVGYENESTIPLINELYHFNQTPIQFCRRTSAELINYAANAFLAMKISYLNMFSQLCETFGADITDIAQSIDNDPHMAPHFLKAGIGYGGSCIPKDIHTLIQTTRAEGVPLPLLEAADRVNAWQMTRFVERIEQRLDALADKRIALFGLSCKPGTDDIREAPSLRFTEITLAKGAHIVAHDPLVKAFPYPQVELFSDPYTCMQGADAIVILTDWPDFRAINWKRMCELPKEPLLFDGCNLFSIQEIKMLAGSCPLEYHSIGRPCVKTFESEKQVR
jgi:UDPglucose 6-dehydrogenase